MNIDLSKMLEINGYLQGKLDCVDQTIRELPFDYKKRLSQRFNAIDTTQINSKVTGKLFYVSRKMDGHFQLVFFNGKEAFMIGRNGTVRANLPCLAELAHTLVEKKVASLIAAAELYKKKDNERSRVYDVIAALSHEQSVNTLALAVFDLIHLNGKQYQFVSYEETYNMMTNILPAAGLCHVVETEIAKSKKGISKICNNWVEIEGAEGLVIRCEMPFLYKVKPKHTFDCVVVGYTEGINEHKGKVKSLLFGLMRDEGIYQIIGKVGTNFSE